MDSRATTSRMGEKSTPSATTSIATIGLMLLNIAVASFFVLQDRYLNDEGLLTYYWARWAWEEPLAIFFFQRLRPLLAMLYAPSASLGAHATFVAHVVVGACSIPLIAWTASYLGCRRPFLAALVLGLSPLQFFGLAAGISNTDGVAGVCFTLFCLARGHPLLAGIVAGALPWVRFELGLFSTILAGYGLVRDKDRSLLLGMMVFPLLYSTAGALYHGDPLWIVHYPPNVAADPSNPVWQGQARGLRYLLEPLLAVTPITPFLVGTKWSRLSSLERALLLYLVGGALVMNVLPIFQIGNFGTAPRYCLHLLPAIAILSARVLESWEKEEMPSIAATAGSFGLCLWLATRQEHLPTVLVLLLLMASTLTAAMLRRGALTLSLAALIVVLGPLVRLRTEIPPTDGSAFLDVVRRGLASSASSQPILLTNVAILADLLAPRIPGLDVRFLAGVDMTGDSILINPRNGQQQAIGRVAHHLYGTAIFRPITPDEFPDGTLFFLVDDPRVPRLLPDNIWGGSLQVVETHERFRLLRLARDPQPVAHARRGHRWARTAGGEHGGQPPSHS